MATEQTPDEQLQELEARLEIFEGLVRVLDSLHQFVDVVLAGTDHSDTVEALGATLGLSRVQGAGFGCA